MFCQNCGAELKDDTKFCPNCGKAASAENTTNDLTPERRLSNNPNALILKSSLPLPDKLHWVKWAYFAALFSAVINVLLCLVMLTIVLLIHTSLNSHYLKKIREMRFQFVQPVTVDELYEKIKPALKKTWDDKVDFDRVGDTLSIQYKKTVYDINLLEDGTFGVWWRKSLARAIFSNVNYNEVRLATATIAYELQKQFNVN